MYEDIYDVNVIEEVDIDIRDIYDQETLDDEGFYFGDWGTEELY